MKCRGRKKWRIRYAPHFFAFASFLPIFRNYSSRNHAAHLPGAQNHARLDSDDREYIPRLASGGAARTAGQMPAERKRDRLGTVGNLSLFAAIAQTDRPAPAGRSVFLLRMPGRERGDPNGSPRCAEYPVFACVCPRLSIGQSAEFVKTAACRAPCCRTGRKGLNLINSASETVYIMLWIKLWKLCITLILQAFRAVDLAVIFCR